MAKQLKQLWKGIFNFHNEMKRVFAFAYSKDQAKIIMARRLAKEQEVLPVVVLSWMKEHPDSFDIKIETEFKEIENERDN
jgi:hypothetical protein